MGPQRISVNVPDERSIQSRPQERQSHEAMHLVRLLHTVLNKREAGVAALANPDLE